MWLKQQIDTNRNLLISTAILAVLAVAIGFMAAQDFGIIVMSIPAGIIAIILLYICLSQPLVGFYIIIFSSFFAFYPSRMFHTNIPISTGVDVLFLFVLIGTLREKKSFSSKDNLLRSPASIFLICYALFFLVEILNPNMLSVDGWLLYARKFATYLISYFIAYKLLDSKEKVKFFFTFWIILSFITAVYGCYQQWFGVTGFEMQEILSDPIEFKLLFQGGMLRKFSFLTDPVQFGVLSGAMAVFTLVLAIAQKNKTKRNLMFIMSVFMVLGMLYSGTRTAIVTIPAGIALYALMTIHNKKTIFIVGGAFIIAVLVLFAPVDNAVLNRMRTVVDPKEASLNVRDEHRKYIQPYIYAHPLGGGIATSGSDGIRFNQGHPLAGFPPDSGLLKYAIETGWVGLILINLLYFAALYQGMIYYYQAKNKEIKNYLLASVVCLFAIIVTQYSQVSVGQLPFVIFFFAIISITKRLLEFDKDLQKNNLEYC